MWYVLARRAFFGSILFSAFLWVTRTQRLPPIVRDLARVGLAVAYAGFGVWAAARGGLRLPPIRSAVRDLAKPTTIAIVVVVTVGFVLLRRIRFSGLLAQLVGMLRLLAIGAAFFAILRWLPLRLTNNDIAPDEVAEFHIVAILSFGEALCIAWLALLPHLFDHLEEVGARIFLAVRQLRVRKSAFLTVISLLAFFGVALSSFGLCLTISVMGGFGNDLKRKIIGNNAHVLVDHDREGIANWRPLVAQIAAIRGVTSATPLVQGEVMVTSQTNLSGVILRGIDAQSGAATEILRRQLVRGHVDDLLHPERLLDLNANERRPITSREQDDAPTPPPSRGQLVEPAPEPPGPGDTFLRVGSVGNDVLPGIIVGRELATNLHLAAGDEVRVVSPFGGMVTPAGPLPKTRLFRVAGVFYSGMYEYDTKYAYVTIPVAQNFFNYEGDQISSIEVRVADEDRADRIAAEIQPLVRGRGFQVRDWKQLNRNLFRALGLEKLMMFVLLGVAIMVASFAIVATLLLLVLEKGREIAVLKAMGASDSFIAQVFVLVGFLIGLVGSTLGVGSALLVCTLIQRIGIPLDPEVYYIDRLPIYISLNDYGLVLMIAMLICLVATVYPAAAASRLRPVEGMRFG